MGRWPALDGVRGLAIVLVMIEHTHLAPFHGGGLGVDLFFVLSGFLISGLLLAEFERSSRLDVRRFYYRRALRLLPALGVLVTATTVAALILRHTEIGTATLAMTPRTLLYVANLGRSDLGDPSLLAHTWSLSIEEQFYLVWPLALVLLLRSRLSSTALVGVVMAVTGIATLTRTASYLAGPPTAEHFARWYFRTDTKVDALLLGCVIALLLASDLSQAAWFGRLPLRAVGVASLLALLAVVPWLRPTPVGYTMQLSIFRLASAGLILSLVVGSVPAWLKAAFGARWLRMIGVLSYSLYLWHLPVFTLIQYRLGRSLASLVVEVLVTLALAVGSYRLVERPFLRARERLASTRQEPSVRGEFAVLAEADATRGST